MQVPREPIEVALLVVDRREREVRRGAALPRRDPRQRPHRRVRPGRLAGLLRGARAGRRAARDRRARLLPGLPRDLDQARLVQRVVADLRARARPAPARAVPDDARAAPRARRGRHHHPARAGPAVGSCDHRRRGDRSLGSSVVARADVTARSQALAPTWARPRTSSITPSSRRSMDSTSSRHRRAARSRRCP